MLYKNVLLNSRVTKLEEQLALITKRKSRKRKRIQHGGTLEYSIGSAQVAAEASTAPQRSKKARNVANRETALPASRRCRKCGKAGHNARTCNIDVEGSSESESSIVYIGSLFDSDESDVA